MKSLNDEGSDLNTWLTNIKFNLSDNIKEEKDLYLNINKVIDMVFKSGNDIDRNEVILDQFQIIRDLSKRFIKSKKKEIEQEYQKV